MEKICIARRRKDIQQIGMVASATSLYETAVDQRMSLVSPHLVQGDAGLHDWGKASPIKVAEGKNEMISFDLTSEQCNSIKSGGFAHYLSHGISKGAAVDVKQREDGHIRLSFYFNRINDPRFLKSRDVCDMLQISRSCLGNLIRNKKLKSYKVGRIRRFLMEDIMEYLTGNEYFESTR